MSSRDATFAEITYLDDVTNPPDLERMARDLSKWRAIFVVLALILPAIFYALFERQARRLDALGVHGVVMEATVTSTSGQGGTEFTDYAYEFDGKSYTWNVGQKEAPFPIGRTFPIVVSRDDPSLSRPGTDIAIGTREAAKNRSFSSKAVGALFVFLAICALGCHLRLRRLRATGLTEANDPAAYRNRLIFMGALLSPFIVAMFLFGLSDAKEKGESIWPGIIGLGFGLAVLGGTLYFTLRHGPAHAQQRAARILKYAVPLAVIIAVLRLVIWMATGNG